MIELSNVLRNIHTPYANICLRNLNRAFICTSNDEKLQKLIDMSNFAKEIAKKSRKHARCLAKNTWNSLSQTCM